MATEDEANDELAQNDPLANEIAQKLGIDDKPPPSRDVLPSKNGQFIADGVSKQAETDKNSDVDSHLSQSSRSIASSAAARGATKVYYHIDDEQTPYCTEVPVPGDRITLADFKLVLNRTNFKFYCKAIDPEVGGEVKAEIRDDSQTLSRSSNGHFELFLLTAEGSTSQSDGNSSAGMSKIGVVKRAVHGQNALYPLTNNSQVYWPRQQQQQKHQSHNNFKPQFGQAGHRRRPFEDSTVYTTETDAHIYSDDESRLSTSTDNITSVSRQNYNLYRRRRRQFPRSRRQQPSRASSLSSMTETSMALEVITVTLNMDTVNFLGISIVGQSSSRGDNGIYVANVMPGGAVALDGRIEPGDMILQVNDISFENFKNDQAVNVLKQAVSRRGPIKLTVAKSFDAGRANYFSVPPREPVRPIDTHAWVQHTNAIRGMAVGGGGGGGTLVSAMNAIPEGSEGAPTPIPGHQPPQQQQHQLQHHPQATTAMFLPTMALQQQQQQRPASSSTTGTSNGSGGGAPQTIVGPGGIILAMQPRLDMHTDKRRVLHAMAMPSSGLDIRDRTWLKIPIPMSFLGSSFVDWLLENIDGIRDRKEARRYAGELLKERLIAHVVNKQQFTEQCYYVFGEEFTDLLRLRNGGENGIGMTTNFHHQQQQQHIEMQEMNLFGTNRMLPPPAAYLHSTANIGSSEYASMPPVSPYPTSNMPTAQQMMQQKMDFHQQQQQHKFGPSIYGPGTLNQLAQQQQRANEQQQQQFAPVGIGTTSQASNNSNEESSGSEQRRKAILPPAPSLNSVGTQPNVAFHQHQQHFGRLKYTTASGQHGTALAAAASAQQQRPQLTGAPPSTPIGDEAASANAVMMMGGNSNKFVPATLQKAGQQPSNVRLTTAEAGFPELFVEHF